MKIINQSHEIMRITPQPLWLIEHAGRTCYLSEDKITRNSDKKFVKMIMKNGHHSVIEHASITVRFITDRSVTHELVRHRLCSYSQESQRYVNFGGKDIEFIRPVWFNFDLETVNKDNTRFNDWHGFLIGLPDEERVWLESMSIAEEFYNELLSVGQRPEQARSVLPNSTKTEIVMSCNFREMRHVLKLRTSKKAHPQIKALMIPLLKELQERVPVIFDDIGEK